jgi:hypothetical protein
MLIGDRPKFPNPRDCDRGDARYRRVRRSRILCTAVDALGERLGQYHLVAHQLVESPLLRPLLYRLPRSKSCRSSDVHGLPYVQCDSSHPSLSGVASTGSEGHQRVRLSQDWHWRFLGFGILSICCGLAFDRFWIYP